MSEDFYRLLLAGPPSSAAPVPVSVSVSSIWYKGVSWGGEESSPASSVTSISGRHFVSCISFLFEVCSVISGWSLSSFDLLPGPLHFPDYFRDPVTTCFPPVHCGKICRTKVEWDSVQLEDSAITIVIYKMYIHFWKILPKYVYDRPICTGGPVYHRSRTVVGL